MNQTLYLLWSTHGWGVFTKTTCPDTHGVIPEYCYREYQVPAEKERVAFNKLLEVRAKLVESRTIPNKENYCNIFPEISSLLQ